MIAFGCVTTDNDVFRAGAAAAMQAVIEGDSLLMRRHAPECPASACNEMLAHAAGKPGLEAVVLIAEDAALEDGAVLPDFRSVLGGEAETAVVGVSPAAEVAGLLAARQAPARGGLEQVDAVDGALVVLSPWAAATLRFDPDLDVPLDGAVVDLCLQARAHGRRVAAAGMGVARAGGERDREQQRIETALLGKWKA